MTYAVRVTENYVGLMGRYVAEGQSIVPGAPLVDIMTPGGIVETIISEGWGVVAHIEGGRIFADRNERQDDDNEDDDETGESGSSRSSSGGVGIVFSKGDVICHIVARSDRIVKGKGLIPRASPALRSRRLVGLSP